MFGECLYFFNFIPIASRYALIFILFQIFKCFIIFNFILFFPKFVTLSLVPYQASVVFVFFGGGGGFTNFYHLLANKKRKDLTIILWKI
jgi:hypothetical protein